MTPPVSPCRHLPARAYRRTVVLPRDRFHVLIATEPAVRDVLLASLAAELRRITTHVEELHFLDITGRLAARLVRLAEESQATAIAAASAAAGAAGRAPRSNAASDPRGSHGPAPIRLRSTLTQAELASMVGCTRQSVNKLLGQFADSGLIRLDREGVLVTDLAGLVAAARR